MRTTKIIVDILMTIFVILSFVRWEESNFLFHAVVGTACTLLFGVHIFLHRKWLKATTKSVLTGKLNKKLTGKYVVNILLLAIWGVAIVTGFLAVGWVAFARLHAVTSRVGLVLIVVHVFQHIPQIKSYMGMKKF